MFARRTDWKLAKNRYTETLERAHREGRTLLDLTVSNPTRAGITYDSHAVLNALRNERALDYEPDPRGMPLAREAIAGYYAARQEPGAHLPSAEQIVLTTSTSEAYSFVFRLLCEPGDEVLVPMPSYPLFEFLAGVCDVTLRGYELVYHDGWQIDFHSLVQALTPRSRAVMLVHPNNPTGSYVKPHERAELNAICRARGLGIVADEVFLDYALDGATRESFAWNTDALTFTLSGISKISGLPQMKLAWMVVSGPQDLASEAIARVEVIADTFLSMSAPIQLAAPAFLAQRMDFQDQLMKRVRANLADLDSQLAASDCRRLELEGGWYATIRVPRTRSDEELAVELIERAGVAVHPGHFFDFHDEGYLVVTLLAPEEEFARGVERIARFDY